MPIILGDADYDKWLDPSVVDPAAAKYMLAFYPADEMVAEPVSTHVNNVHNNDADLVASCTLPFRSWRFTATCWQVHGN